MDLSRDRTPRERKDGRGARTLRLACTRDRVSSRRVSRSRPRLDQFRMTRRRRPRRAAAARAFSGAIDRCERAEGAGRRARLPRPAAWRRATSCAATRSCAAASSARFKRIFVDEFQDTDPLQAEILLLLAADDPTRDGLATRHAACPARCSSSAIRSSRSTASARRRRRLSRGLRAARSRAGASAVHADHELPQRARRSSACVNAAFAPVMTGDPVTLQARYVPLLRTVRRARRSRR